MSALPGIGGIGDILKHAREAGRQFKDIRERLKSRSFTASVGGDLVTATVNGEGELLKLQIDPSAASKNDREMLEDLVVAAVNQAIKKSREAYREELSGLTGGIDVAGILGLS